MRVSFADTLYWIAMTYRHDNYHEMAAQVSRRLGQCRLLTSELVLGEYLTGMSKHGQYWREQAALRVDGLLRDPNVDVEPQSREGFKAALELYRRRLDKEYSFVDCDGMVLMNRQGIREVLTHDHHFEQEGFTILLKQSAA